MMYNWRGDITEVNERERTSIKNEIIKIFINETGKEGKDLISYLNSSKAEFIGFVPQLSFSKNGKTVISHLSMPALLFIPKNTPLCIIISPVLTNDLKNGRTNEVLSSEEFEQRCQDTYFSPVSKGVVLGLNWYHLLNETRKKKEYGIAKKNTLDGIARFSNGKESMTGIAIVEELTNDSRFMGFAPNIVYVKERSRFKDELMSEWAHPFSIPTVCYMSKNLPMIVLSNGNIEYNISKLGKIKISDKIKKEIKNETTANDIIAKTKMAGIIG